MPALSLLKKVTVKIVCNDEDDHEEGSGIITGDGEYIYVLTCAHCLTKKSNKTLFGKENIHINFYHNYQWHELNILEDVKADPSDDKDMAVVKIENPEVIDLNYTEYVRFLKEDIGYKAVMAGFPGEKNTLDRCEVFNTSDNEWELKTVPITVQNQNPDTIYAGMSGGGVFYVDEGTNVLYVVAYFKGVVDENGDYNKVKCYPISNFSELLPQKEIDEIPVESIEVEKEVVLGTDCIYTLKERLLRENHPEKLISNQKTDEIINELRNEDVPVIMLTGLSGLGKTRLLYEAFNVGVEIENAFYCKFEKRTELLLTQFDQLLLHHIGQSGIIVIDDCPLDLFPDFYERRLRLNDQFRLIATNHNYFDVNDDRRWKTIRITNEDMVDAVNDYIENALQPDDQTRTEVEELKDMADGYPQMALELVKHYEKDVPASVDVVEYMMPKLLSFNEDASRKLKEETILQTLSLCQPMPYINDQRSAFRYLIESDCFTPLYEDAHWEEREDIAESLIEKYKPTLIDVQSNWLHVRPFPLAVWLTRQWFKNCTKPRFARLLEDVRAQNEYIQNVVGKGFCKHIEQMHGNKDAFKLVAKLVNPKEDDSPFLNEEVLCSGLGSRFFLAMSSVNPAAIAQGLAHLLLPHDNMWLRENLKCDARRNIVWALEHLCFAKESYHDAVLILAKLALAENEEHISNNATGQLIQLFHIQLSGTEASLEERLETLNYLFYYGDEYRDLTIRCLASALASTGFVRTGGAERFGQEKKTDYMPNTYAEIFKYWRACVALLRECVKTLNVQHVEAVAQIVESSTYRWIIERRFDLLVPLLECVSEAKAYDWEKEYEELQKSKNRGKLKNMGEDDVIISSWIAKLRPNVFLSDLKDARYELWNNYRTASNYSQEKAMDIFTPLVEKFIANGIYKDPNELKLILEDKDYVDNVFIILLKELADADVQIELFATVNLCIEGLNGAIYSSFLRQLCFIFRGTPAVDTLMESLFANGYHELYIRLMASTEDRELTHLLKLKSQYRHHEELDWLSLYLNGYDNLDAGMYNDMLGKVYELHPDKVNVIMDYIVSRHFFYDVERCEGLLPVIKRMIPEYVLNDVQGRNTLEFCWFVGDLLEKVHDPELAVRMNRKLIEYYRNDYHSGDCKETFRVLISKYADVVWDEFMDALLSEDNPLLIWQLKDVIGSGYGFGAGVLYQLPDIGERLKALCEKYPETAPPCIGDTAPCFAYVKVDDRKSVKGFSSIILWLLDEYGDRDDVRNSIHSNLNTFSWTGSTIPYYRNCLICYMQLFEHKHKEVSDWAKQCAEACKKNIDIESEQETYMKLHYGMK